MTDKELKAAALHNGLECIIEGDDVCIRPMLDDAGRREVRAPEPHEFVTREMAEARLA